MKIIFALSFLLASSLSYSQDCSQNEEIKKGLMGVTVDETTSNFIKKKVKEREGNKKRRESPEAKLRRKEVLKKRKQQYVSYNTTYKKRKVKHTKEVKGAGICKSPGCLSLRHGKEEYCSICCDLFVATV